MVIVSARKGKEVEGRAVGLHSTPYLAQTTQSREQSLHANTIVVRPLCFCVCTSQF